MNALWEKIVRDADERVKAAFRAGKTDANGIDMTAALTIYAEPSEGTPEMWFIADVTILAAMALQALEQPPKISVGALRRAAKIVNNIACEMSESPFWATLQRAEGNCKEASRELRNAQHMLAVELQRNESPDWNKAADVEWLRGRYPHAKWDEDAGVWELEIGCIKPITLAYSCGVGWHLNGRFIWLDCSTITRRMVVDLVEALNK